MFYHNNMRKIGEIKGVPVVEGNVNKITKNQIHYKEEEGGIQLSKRSNDNKLNSITGGSSEGGGVKEYYYKVLDLDIYANSQITNYLNLICSLSGVIVELGDEDPTIQITRNVGHYGEVNDLWKTLRDMFVIGFRFYDDTAFIPTNNESMIVKIEKGNLEQRLIDIIKKSVPQEEDPDGWLQEELIPALRQSFKEITKEEYESMVTYKPE